MSDIDTNDLLRRIAAGENVTKEEMDAAQRVIGKRLLKKLLLSAALGVGIAVAAHVVLSAIIKPVEAEYKYEEDETQTEIENI